MARRMNGLNAGKIQKSWCSSLFIASFNSRFGHEQISTKMHKPYTNLSVSPSTSIIYQRNLLIPTVLDGSSQNRFYNKTSIHDFSANIQRFLILQIATHSTNYVLQYTHHNFEFGENRILALVKCSRGIGAYFAPKRQNRNSIKHRKMIEARDSAPGCTRSKNSSTVMHLSKLGQLRFWWIWAPIDSNSP